MEGKGKIRYAVVGAGSIAQEAVLPAFQNAQNSELVAIVSGDEAKREELGRKYKVHRTYSYDKYDECLSNGGIDAVYIALPNHLHRPYAERAARAGIHILCEKPLAQNEAECIKIIEAARAAGVCLMTAYRLHFEEANLEAVRICESGELGELRIFHSVFGQQVEGGNVRLAHSVAEGGGPLFDMGVYCINAARYLFRDEPVEVTAFRGSTGERRFEKSEEMMGVVLRFPQDRLANFTVSFGVDSVDSYTVVGTKGNLVADPAYAYATDIHLRVTSGGSTREQNFPKRDQFAPELVYFSDCLLNNCEPEPSGDEGLADVQIVSAAYRACEAGRALQIDPVRRYSRPEPSQKISRPPVESPELVHARLPSGAKRKE